MIYYRPKSGFNDFMSKTSTRSKVIFVAISLAILIAIFELPEIRATVYAELSELKLIPMPERFTELYFNNHLSLPKQTVAGQSASFSFTIHNVEGITTTYPYRVYFEYPRGHQVDFASSTVTLADGATTTVAVSHIFLASNETGKVVVDLTALNQQIDFLVPATNP